MTFEAGGDLATNDDRSVLSGAGNVGVIARSGRLFRRDDESRSESYSDILGRAGLAEIEGQGNSAANQAAQAILVEERDSHGECPRHQGRGCVCASSRSHLSV